MVLAPETATSPLAQAPPDRPTLQLEQALNNVRALILADRKIDDNERQLLRGFILELAMRAANGGIGMGGGTPPAESPEMALPPGPGEMNANTEDMGTIEGAEPMGEEY